MHLALSIIGFPFVENDNFCWFFITTLPLLQGPPLLQGVHTKLNSLSFPGLLPQSWSNNGRIATGIRGIFCNCTGCINIMSVFVNNVSLVSHPYCQCEFSTFFIFKVHFDVFPGLLRFCGFSLQHIAMFEGLVLKSAKFLKF